MVGLLAVVICYPPLHSRSVTVLPWAVPGAHGPHGTLCRVRGVPAASRGPALHPRPPQGPLAPGGDSHPFPRPLPWGQTPVPWHGRGDRGRRSRGRCSRGRAQQGGAQQGKAQRLLLALLPAVQLRLSLWLLLGEGEVEGVVGEWQGVGTGRQCCGQTLTWGRVHL